MTDRQQIGLAVFLILASLAVSPTASASYVDDGMAAMKAGKMTEAASHFTDGCVASDKDSCNALAVLGHKTGNKQFEMIGSANACRLGDATSCSFAGGEMVLQGQTDEGVKFLRAGCKMGNKKGCAQLDLLKLPH